MDLHTWLAFVAATCVIAISPGSGAVLAMSHGLSYGVRRTSVTILGLQLGLLLLLLVAGAGVGSLLLASETAFNTVKVLGACLIVLTLGFFLLVINALMLQLTSWLAGVFGLGFHVDGFWPAFWGALIISVVGALLGGLLGSGRTQLQES